jgi:hypothetical protein
VLAPKVRGTLVLERALAREPLDFFVLYSSLSALAGLPGQIDYTAANAFLDAFAADGSRSTGGAHRVTRALDWSAWQQVGMAAELAQQHGAGRGDVELPAPAHPLLDRCLARNAEETVFATEMRVSRRWLLDEHRLRDGVPLLPGTGFLELARAGFESPPEDRVVEIRDALFLAPFPLPEDESREIRVELRRSGAASRFTIASPADPEDPTAFVEHARGEIAYTDDHVPPVCDLEALRARCARVEEVAELRFQDHLVFGPRWRVLRRIHWGEGEALLTLELPASFAEDLDEYLLHPSLLDMATAGAQGLVPGNAEEHDLYIPVSYGRLRLWRALERRIHSHVRWRGVPEGAGDDFAAFDVTIVDDGGRTLAAIDDFVLKRIDDPASLDPVAAAAAAAVQRQPRDTEEASRRAAAAHPVLAHLDQAILPAEGLDALDRALAVDGVPQLVVSSLDLDAWIAAVTAPPPSEGRAVREAAAKEIELTPELRSGLAEIEAALESHPAVQRAAAMAFADRPGQRRLAAYMIYQAEQDATVSELRRHLRKSLSESWIPASFVELDELPRTPDGDLDRSALPDPFGQHAQQVAPRTDTERAIAEVWRDVLGIDQVGVHDNFFDVGGHSLLAMRVIAKLGKRLGVKLDNAIMVLHTLEQIAAECDQQRGGTEAGDATDGPPSREAAAPEQASGGGLGRWIRSVKRRDR